MRRSVLFFFALTLMMGVLAPQAGAAPPAVNETTVEKGVVDSFQDFLFCFGADPVPYDITTHEHSGVLHVSAAGVDASGDLIPPYHVTGTFTGTFHAEPVAGDYPTIDGRFTVWFGENANNKNGNGTFTFAATGKGDDGSKYKERVVAHFSMNANGSFNEFAKLNCNGN